MMCDPAVRQPVVRQIVTVGFLQAPACTNRISTWRRFHHLRPAVPSRAARAMPGPQRWRRRREGSSATQ